MTDLVKAAKQALEALENLRYKSIDPERIIPALRTALEEYEKQKPVAWMIRTGHGTHFRETITPELAALEQGGRKVWTPLYTSSALIAHKPGETE